MSLKKQMKKPRAPRRGLTTKAKGNKVTNIASVSEAFAFETMQMNTIYADYGCSLFQHERARAVAQGYQEYRIKLVEYRFKPASDTYSPTGGVNIPYMYYLVDKLRSNNGLQTTESFTHAGAQAIRFDDKTLTIKYKPSVLVDSWDAQAFTAVPRQYRISPWLTTNDYNTVGGGFNPSSVDHLGLRWVVVGQNDQLQYTCERVVHIEFRKPMWVEAPQGAALTVVEVGTLIEPKLSPIAKLPLPLE